MSEESMTITKAHAELEKAGYHGYKIISTQYDGTIACWIVIAENNGRLIWLKLGGNDNRELLDFRIVSSQTEEIMTITKAHAELEKAGYYGYYIIRVTYNGSIASWFAIAENIVGKQIIVQLGGNDDRDLLSIRENN